MKKLVLLCALALAGSTNINAVATLTINGNPPVVLNKASEPTRRLFKLVTERRTPEDAAFVAAIQQALIDGADVTWISGKLDNILHHLLDSAQQILGSFAMGGRSFSYNGQEPIVRETPCTFPFMSTLKLLLEAGANASYGYVYRNDSFYSGEAICGWARHDAFVDDMEFFSEIWPDAYELLTPYRRNPFMTMAIITFATTAFGLVHG